MPAIQLTRLKIQSASLVEYFATPEVFIHHLHALLNFYSNRVYRFGEVGEPIPLSKAYHVPRPVLHQIIVELQPKIIDDPRAALSLADALWEQPFLEFRLFAAAIVGRIPSSHAKEVIQRVDGWIKPGLEEQLCRKCLKEGLSLVREERPEMFIELIEKWLTDERTFYHRVGLMALETIIEQSNFEDFPWVFRVLGTMIRKIRAENRSDLMNLIGQLAKKAPKETNYFLRQAIVLKGEDPNILRLVRLTLSNLPSEFAEDLRKMLREGI